MTNRWVIYQRERFPLVQYVPMVAVFALAAVAYSARLRGAPLGVSAWFVAFVTSLTMFMLLRIADEYKDAADDARWRPYRAVPRGLVRLPELGRLAIGLAVLQIAAAVWYYRPLVPVLLLLWAYFGLMSKEFFAPAWLRARPVAYLVSHMFIMPLLDFYATACDWLPAGGGQRATLVYFLVASFFNGIVIEVGRKIRCAADEEEGVETYSALWGRSRAVFVLLAAMVVTAVLAVLAADQVGLGVPVALILGATLPICTIIFLRFVFDPSHENARWFEPVSGAWTLVLYLSLGLLSLWVGAPR